MTNKTIFNAIFENNMDLFNTFDKYEIIKTNKDKGYSPLFYACIEEKLDFIKRIVEIKKEIEQKSIVSVDDCNRVNHSCLMVSKNIEIIKYLISEGADINRKDKYGDNCLLISKSIDITKIYLENGLDINYVDKGGLNALFTSYNRNNIPYFLFLIGKKIIIDHLNLKYINKGIYKNIIDNPFYYYMKENIKNYFLDIFNFLYEILDNDIGSIIYANPVKIYNGKFCLNKNDIKFFLNTIKYYKGVQSQKYKEIFISEISNH